MNFLRPCAGFTRLHFLTAFTALGRHAHFIDRNAICGSASRALDNVCLRLCHCGPNSWCLEFFLYNNVSGADVKTTKNAIWDMGFRISDFKKGKLSNLKLLP
jgi:hypothetical protein